MSNTIKAAIITGVATIVAGFIGGMGYGKSSEQKNIQNEIQAAMGNVVNFMGDNNEVTINSVKDLVDEYQRLQSQNKSLLDQNTKYFSDLSEANYQVSALQSKTNDMPEINFNNLALSIDAQDILINKNNSMVTIDGRDYFSREIVESLISDEQNFTIKNDTLFIGNVVANKANLFEHKIMHQSNCEIRDTATDSYGNIYANILYMNTLSNYNHDYIIFVLNEQYSLLRFSVAIVDFAQLDKKGVLTVKADNQVVYTSDSLNKKTELFTEVDIPINYCTLLTIEYDGEYTNGCIISDAIVYN